MKGDEGFNHSFLTYVHQISGFGNSRFPACIPRFFHAWCSWLGWREDAERIRVSGVLPVFRREKWMCLPLLAGKWRMHSFLSIRHGSVKGKGFLYDFSFFDLYLSLSTSSHTMPSKSPCNLYLASYLSVVVLTWSVSNVQMSLNSLVSERPIAQARFTGTAFPICLYWADSVPANCQSSGNVCILAYSLTVSGRVSKGWQRSVCFWAGAQVSVRLGSSQSVASFHVFSCNIVGKVSPIASFRNELHDFSFALRVFLSFGWWDIGIEKSAFAERVA